jgi:hypothetical protein
VHCVETFHYR